MYTSSIFEIVSTGWHGKFDRFKTGRPIGVYIEIAPTLQCLQAKEKCQLVEKKFNRYPPNGCVFSP